MSHTAAKSVMFLITTNMDTVCYIDSLHFPTAIHIQ